jgi:hypothetical protein
MEVVNQQIIVMVMVTRNAGQRGSIQVPRPTDIASYSKSKKCIRDRVVWAWFRFHYLLSYGLEAR